MNDNLKIGVIGLGAMGLGMASCLARSGFHVTGFDIQQRAVERLIVEGGKAAGTHCAAAATADVLIIVVATSDQTSSVLFDGDTGALATLPQNSVILLCITAPPEYVVNLERQLKSVGRPDVRLIDCPVSGGAVRAWKGTLSLLCAGKESDITFARDALECLCSKLHIVPGGIGAGSNLKLVHQILVGVHILASVEVMGLAFVAGLNLLSVYKSVMRGDSASWLFAQRAAHMLDEKKVPASSLAIITKDMAMVTACGQHHKVPLPLSSIAHQIFTQVQSTDWGTGDDCVTMNAYLLGRGSLQNLRQRPISPPRSCAFDESAISDLLIGIHSAVAIEVLRFARTLGLDTAVVKEVVQNAAGSSVIFNKVWTQLEPAAEYFLGSIDNFDSIAKNMAVAIENAKSLNYPLFLASAALQQYYFQ